MRSRIIKCYLDNFFWLFFTYLLSPIFYLQIFFFARRSPKSEGRTKKGQSPSKILIIQPAKIGDMVCMTPIFRELKKRLPDSYLAAMVISKTKDILKNNPRLDEIMLIEDFSGIAGRIRLIRKLRKEKYDWAINFAPFSFYSVFAFWALVPNRITTTFEGAGEISRLFSIFNNYRLEYQRPGLILKHHFDLLKFLGIEAFSEEKEVFIKPEEEQKAMDFLKEHNLGSNDLPIGIHLTSGMKAKQWGINKFAALADLLIEKLSAKIIFTGSAQDCPRIQEVRQLMKKNNLSSIIDSSGIFQLSELPALISNLKLVIGADSGPIYIADALNIPSVVIAGMVDMRGQHPQSSHSKIIQKDVNCPPCSFYFVGPSFCKLGDFRCFEQISSEEVLDAAVALMANQRII